MKFTDIYNFGERPFTKAKIFKPLLVRMSEPYKFTRKNFEGNLVLDFGCGEGYGSAILSERFPRVIAVDKDIVVFTTSEGEFHNSSTIKLCSNEDLPFKDRTFDIICCFQTLEHIEKYEMLLEEFKRVLKKSGVLLISTPNKAKIVSGLNPYHYREFTPDELHGILSRFFSDVKLLGIFGDQRFNEFKSKETEIGRTMANKVSGKIYSLLPLRVKKWLFSCALFYGYYKLSKMYPEIWQINLDDSFYFSDTDISNCIDIMAICRNN